jgi:hypothetical protein
MPAVVARTGLILQLIMLYPAGAAILIVPASAIAEIRKPSFSIIASEAKQPRAQRATLDCFAKPRNDGVGGVVHQVFAETDSPRPP